MGIDAILVEKLIRQAIEEVKNDKLISNKEISSSKKYGIFDFMNEAIEASDNAQKKLANTSMSDRAKYVDTIRKAVIKRENLELISRMTIEETEIGKYEDKLIKNRVAAEKTPGIEDLTTEAITGDNGITLIEYCPFGVIGSITPTTNPTETIICNSMSMIAGGNTVVFSPHPRSKNVSIKLITILNKALEEVGAPCNLITTVKEPSIDNTNIMMEHPKVRMLVATGGSAIVKKVMSTGKKAIGAGAGNPPVVVDETADIEKAAIDIINGCSFDNNVLCIAEKEVFAVDKICDYLIHYMKLNGAYEIKNKETIQKLLDLVTNKNGGPKTSFVGKSAKYILNKIGIEVDNSIKVIIMEVDKEHHFVTEEMMMPILPIVRTKDVDEAIEYAYISENGNRHTSIMHSKNVDKLTKMAKLLQTTIFVKNGPSYAGVGIGGEGATTFTIAGPTGEGLTTARSFCRKRKCVIVDAFNIR